jgi:hypothetical protein
MKESLNSGGQQFHQYQQNKRSSLTLTYSLISIGLIGSEAMIKMLGIRWQTDRLETMAAT